MHRNKHGNRKHITGANNHDTAEERFSTIIYKSPIPTAVGGADGSIIAFNEALEILIGYKSYEIINVEDWANKLYPDKEYREFVGKNIKQALDGQKQGCTEFTITCKDGSTKVIDFYTSFFQGGLIIQMIDVTARKNAEKRVKQSEERLRNLFETMTEGVALIALDGQIVQANSAAERILGLKRSEIESRNYISSAWEIIRPDGTPMPPEEMAGPRAMKENCSISDVIMGVKRPEGTVSWLSVSATPLKNKAGGFAGIVSTFTDITERKRAEEELRESEQQLFRIYDSVGVVLF